MQNIDYVLDDTREKVEWSGVTLYEDFLSLNFRNIPCLFITGEPIGNFEIVNKKIIERFNSNGLRCAFMNKPINKNNGNFEYTNEFKNVLLKQLDELINSSNDTDWDRVK